MKGLLDEIRQQPPHIRELFMWVLVVITFSIVGFAWFRSTTKEFVALLNPEVEKSTALAQSESAKPPSPLTTLASYWKDLTANISELFNLAKKTNNFEINKLIEKPVSPQKLPLSRDK